MSLTPDEVEVGINMQTLMRDFMGSFEHCLVASSLRKTLRRLDHMQLQAQSGWQQLPCPTSKYYLGCSSLKVRPL